MSHELRTPLNSVLGYAQLLSLEFDDPKIRESADSIARGGKHLLALITEVLDLARIESGRLETTIEPVAVAEVLRQAGDMLAPLAAGAAVQLSIGFDECKGTRVHGDRQRLVQVVVNLVGNAIKFNRPGGWVTVRCRRHAGDWVRIEVSDTGLGIAEEDQALLFQPFRRFGDHGIDGTGLGLALSHRFVNLMGGTLELASSSAAGSTFVIALARASEVPAEQMPLDQAG